MKCSAMKSSNQNVYQMLAEGEQYENIKEEGEMIYTSISRNYYVMRNLQEAMSMNSQK